MIKRALAVALAATFVAVPATARPWQRHRNRSHTGEHQARAHVRHHEVDDRAFLWLGLAAIGIGTLYVLNHPPRSESARWNAATLSGDGYVRRPAAYRDRPTTLVRERFDERGRFCREFHQDVRIGRHSEQAWGTTCLQEDGSWRITR